MPRTWWTSVRRLTKWPPYSATKAWIPPGSIPVPARGIWSGLLGVRPEKYEKTYKNHIEREVNEPALLDGENLIQ
jgi:hypothetical protein